MSPHLPPAIQQFFDATNDGDDSRFLAAFAADARLNDWGRIFTGSEEIALWNRTDNIGRQSHFEVLRSAVAEHPDSYLATVNVTGNGFNGTSTFRFTLSNGKIADLGIS